MGEKIRDIKEIRIGDHKLVVEQNKGTHRNALYDIHIQNHKFRLNVTEKDLCKMVLSVLYARENFDSYKGDIHE